MIFPGSLSWSDDGNGLRLETRAMPNTWAAPYHAIVITIPAIPAMTIINMAIIMTNVTIIMTIVIFTTNIILMRIITTGTQKLNTFDNQPPVNIIIPNHPAYYRTFVIQACFLWSIKVDKCTLLAITEDHHLLERTNSRTLSTVERTDVAYLKCMSSFPIWVSNHYFVLC